MSIQFKEAVLYPWQGDRWKNAILWPGLFTYGYLVCCLILGIVAMMVAFMTGNLSVDSLDWGPGLWQKRITGHSANLYNYVTLPAQIIYTSFMAGFQWHFLKKFQNMGLSAPLPEWRDHWKTFLKDGFKVWGFYTLLSIGLSAVLIPLASFQLLGANFLNSQQGAFSVVTFFVLMLPLVLLGSIAWILSVPFVLSPLVFSAQSHRFKDLWQFKRAFKQTLPQYWIVWFALFLCLIVGILYVIGSFFLIMTLIGIFALPFVYSAMMMSMWHLLAQAYFSVVETTHNAASPGLLSSQEATA